jgi:hypothetical protein
MNFCSPGSQIALFTCVAPRSMKRKTAASNNARNPRDSGILVEAHGVSKIRGNTICQKLFYVGCIAKSMMTGRFLSKQLLRNLQDSESMHDALVNQWATVGLIDALMLSIVVAFYNVEVATEGHCDHLSAGSMSCLDIYLSLVASAGSIYMLSLFLAMYFFVVLGTIPKKMTATFVYEFKKIMGLPEMLMIVASGLTLVCMTLWIYLHHASNIGPWLLWLDAA